MHSIQIKYIEASLSFLSPGIAIYESRSRI